jgi:hypothetical protein
MTSAGPVWMLRINPMERRRLADAELARLLEEAVALEQAAGPLARAASDDLYRLIPACGETIRGRILALRRDIHNGRDRSGRPATDLAIELPASVARWSDNHRRLLACHAQLRLVIDGALARERSMLRERLGEGNFLTTLAQSAPGVYDAACRYRARDVTDSKDRKAERALVQYLTRAMIRTSPYGRFTAVGLAEPDPAGVPWDEVTPTTARPQVDVDRALFDYVIGGLVAEAADPLIALPPTARVGDDRITFFQVRPDTIRRLSAPMSPSTRLLVEVLDLGPCRRSALAAVMTERLGLGQTAADRLIGLALGLGLLVTAWRGDEFVAEPVEEALRDLASAGDDRVPHGLRQFKSDLDRLGGDEDDEDDRSSRSSDRPTGRIEVNRNLDKIGDELSRVAQRPAKLMVNEDFVLDPLLVDPGGHRRALDDLTAVTELLWAFDRMHVVRALLAAEIVERFGPGCRIPLARHAETLVRAVYRRERLLSERPDQPVGPADGSLAMLTKVRREAMTALHTGLTGTDDVSWSPADLRGLVAAVPERFRVDPSSYGVVVQPLGPELVFNDTYAGHGPMVSRFLHADRLRGGTSIARLRARLHALYGPGVRLLEDRGCHALSINAHPPILDEAVDVEGWKGLRLAHDVDTDAVSIVDGTGVPVKLLALGAQLPELFAYPVRLATWLCSSGRVALDIVGTFHHQHNPADRPAATVAYPRLRVGHVVVSRRRWYPGADFPNRTDAAGDVDSLLALTRWRADNGIPAEVTLKSLFDGPTRWENLSGTESRDRFFELRRHSKPQYVDLASALMTRVLPRLMERRPPGCIEEALPAAAAGGHACEWMVELARPAGRDRFEWAPGTLGTGATE